MFFASSENEFQAQILVKIPKNSNFQVWLFLTLGENSSKTCQIYVCYIRELKINAYGSVKNQFQTQILVEIPANSNFRGWFFLTLTENLSRNVPNLRGSIPKPKANAYESVEYEF